MPYALLLIIAGILLWTAVSVLAVALCRVAGQHQYAPRPDATTATVAPKISRPRVSTQAATYW